MSIDGLILFILFVLVLLVAVMYYALFELITGNLKTKVFLLSGKATRHDGHGKDQAYSPHAGQSPVPGADDPHAPPRASPPGSWDDAPGEWTDAADPAGFRPQEWEGGQAGWQTSAGQTRSGWESPFMPQNVNPFAPPKGQAREWRIQDPTDTGEDDRTNGIGPTSSGVPPYRSTPDPRLTKNQREQHQQPKKPPYQQPQPQERPESQQASHPPIPAPEHQDPFPPGRTEPGGDPHGDPTTPIPSLRIPFDSSAQPGPSVPDDRFPSDQDTPEDAASIKLPQAEELPVNHRDRYQITGQQVVRFREPGTESDPDPYRSPSPEEKEVHRKT